MKSYFVAMTKYGNRPAYSCRHKHRKQVDAKRCGEEPPRGMARLVERTERKTWVERRQE